MPFPGLWESMEMSSLSIFEKKVIIAPFLKIKFLIKIFFLAKFCNKKKIVIRFYKSIKTKEFKKIKI